MSAPTDSDLGRKLGHSVGPYTLREQLGRGSEGVVFLAQHPQSDQLVALKVLLRPQDAEGVERFKREAQIAAKIPHRGVVRTLDIGRDGDRHYYAMEYCAGPTLKKHMQEQGRLSEEETARIVASLAETMATAHQWGVIHRDLKPSNVILSEVDGSPRVTDFGLARDYGKMRLTRTGDLLGTPLYMSPEQVRGRSDVDHRSDIYALGVIIYQALTGAVPYRADNLADMAQLIVDGDAKPPSERVPGLSPELERICLKAMSPHPDERYPTASALANELYAFLGQGRMPSIEAQAPPARVQTARAQRPPRGVAAAPSKLVALGFALAGLCAVLLGLSVWRLRSTAGEVRAAQRAQVESLLAEVKQQRTEGVHAVTLLRQLERAKALGGGPEVDELVTSVKARELRVDRATTLLDELRSAFLDRAPAGEIGLVSEALELELEREPAFVGLSAGAAELRPRAKRWLALAGCAARLSQSRNDQPLYALFRKILEWTEEDRELSAAGNRLALEVVEDWLPGSERRSELQLYRCLLLARLGRDEAAKAARTEWLRTAQADLTAAENDLMKLRESGPFTRYEIRRLFRSLGLWGGRGRRGPR